MYRIKDIATGKYMSTGRYSYSGISWNKKGRAYRELHYIQSSLERRIPHFYEWLHAEEISKIDIYSRNRYIYQNAPKTWDFIPDTVVIEHYFTGEIVGKLKDIMQ